MKENQRPSKGQGVFCFWNETAWPHSLGEPGKSLETLLDPFFYKMPMTFCIYVLALLWGLNLIA